MSTCSGVVVFKMGVRHLFVLPHLISISFILSSDDLGIGTSQKYLSGLHPLLLTGFRHTLCCHFDQVSLVKEFMYLKRLPA